ncbi:hypothetical protein ACWD69_31635 [Micromonospora chokoriensis]
MVEQFYGEPLSPELIAKVAATPLDQLAVLAEEIDPTRYTASRSDPFEEDSIFRSLDGALITCVEEGMHSDGEPASSVASLPVSLVYLDRIAVACPIRLWALRTLFFAQPAETCTEVARFSPDGLLYELRRHALPDGPDSGRNLAGRHDLVTGLSGLLPLAPLVRSGTISLLSIDNLSYHPDIHVRWMEGLAALQTGVAAGASIAEAADQIDKDGVLALSYAQAFVWIEDYLHWPGFTSLWTSPAGRLWGLGRHRLPDGQEPVGPTPLRVPPLDLSLSDAIRLRADEVVFAEFRLGLRQVLLDAAEHELSSPTDYAQALRASAEENLSEVHARLGALRRRSSFLSAAVPALLSSAMSMGAQYLLPLPGSRAAGGAAGKALGAYSMKKNRQRAQAAEIGERLSSNLLLTGRL